MAKAEELEISCKSLTEENKALSENYNSERVSFSGLCHVYCHMMLIYGSK